ncbi:MAG: AraC family transcriptional regulator [Novosphingobium sp.]|nr:AraC family transcriptional regulator [Novosphingobium sp.]
MIEKEIALPGVHVHLATIEWESVQEVSGAHCGYNICQRLSEDHAPLRIENIAVAQAFPRVRSVAFLPPGRTVRLYPVNRPFRVLNCTFEKDHFEQVTKIDEKLWEEHTRELVEIKDRRLEILMQELYAELMQPGFAGELLIEAASKMILVAMARYGRQLEQTRKPGCGHGLAPWQLRRIHERLAASLDLGYPRIEELSEICNISQSHLMRSFKASTGWPIHKYIAEERLQMAKKLLARSQLNSKEIASRLGFRSPAYFATAFRRMTGKSPSDYRREIRLGGTGSA